MSNRYLVSQAYEQTADNTLLFRGVDYAIGETELEALRTYITALFHNGFIKSTWQLSHIIGNLYAVYLVQQNKTVVWKVILHP